MLLVEEVSSSIWAAIAMHQDGCRLLMHLLNQEEMGACGGNSSRAGRGPVNLPGLPHEMVQQWGILPGPTPSKEIKSTSSKSKMLGQPRRGLGHARTRNPGLVQL